LNLDAVAAAEPITPTPNGEFTFPNLH